MGRATWQRAKKKLVSLYMNYVWGRWPFFFWSVVKLFILCRREWAGRDLLDGCDEWNCGAGTYRRGSVGWERARGVGTWLEEGRARERGKEERAEREQEQRPMKKQRTKTKRAVLHKRT